MKGRKVPFEMDDSLREKWDPLTAEEFWSLREGMTVHVLVAPDQMVEGIFKCGHASGSILSFVKGKPFTGFYFDKEGWTDSQHQIAHSVWWERFYRPKGKMIPGKSEHRWTFFSMPELKSLKQVLVTAHDRAALDDNGVALQHEIQEELDGRV